MSCNETEGVESRHARAWRFAVTLDEFETGLVEVIQRPSDLRPFVCEGSPLACEVFIVGYNPATAMQGDWWRFWKPGYGYQKRLWHAEYLNQRDGEESKTRSRITAIVNGLEGVRVLEANIDARPSKKKSQFPKPITEPFDYILNACKPRLIIAHGVDACRHLEGWPGEVIECKHFIYVGYARIREIVEEARAIVG